MVANPSPKLAAYDNIIDADGHILEPPDAWEKYIDPKFRHRALRVRVGSDGREHLEVDGRPSKFFNIKALTFLGGMGRNAGELATASQGTYVESAPFDSMYPIHPMAEPPAKRVYQRFKDMKSADWYHNVLGGQGPQQALLVLFQYSLFDRFPGMKVVLLESSAGWVGATLDRMDTTYDTPLGKTMTLKDKPSTYFKRHCWVS